MSAPSLTRKVRAGSARSIVRIRAGASTATQHSEGVARPRDMVRSLASRAGLPDGTARILATEQDGCRIAILCRALGISRAGFRRLLGQLPGRGKRKALATFDEHSGLAARRIVSDWQDCTPANER